MAFDLPTQMGYDSDESISSGEVGKVGVAIDSIEDMRVLFDGLPLDKISTSMTINAPGSTLLLLYQLVAEEQGISGDKLTGTIQNDVLKEYIARGTYIYPPKESLRLIADVFAYCQKEMPRWNTISISGYHMAEAGATPAQEIAFTLANAKEYVRAAQKAGLDVDDFAPRLSFFFVARTTLLEEIAKFRAARRIWARIMREEFGATNPKSQMLRFHTQTAGVQLTAQQPEVNLIRVALQGLGAVLGGTQSLHTNSYDEAIALPTEFSSRIARNTQLILQEETHIPDVVDPWGGSYMMEKLTQDMADAAWKTMEEVEARGGMTAAVESGWAKLQIEAAAAHKQARIDAGRDVIVGVNKYKLAEHEDAPLEVRAIDNTAVRTSQVARLAQVRAAPTAPAAPATPSSARSAWPTSRRPCPTCSAPRSSSACSASASAAIARRSWAWPASSSPPPAASSASSACWCRASASAMRSCWISPRPRTNATTATPASGNGGTAKLPVWRATTRVMRPRTATPNSLTNRSALRSSVASSTPAGWPGRSGSSCRSSTTSSPSRPTSTPTTRWRCS